MKPSVSFLIAFLFFELLSIATINFSFCNGSTSNVGCIETERKALVMFKQDLNDTSNRLGSWIGADGDCCNWAGVICDNLTGHVLELHLGNPHTDPFLTPDYWSKSTDEIDAEYDAFERSRLGGKLNPSLLDLKHLNYLDLSYNDFGGIQIPRFLGSMESLTYLNLSYAGFSGMIPHRFGNLSNLQYLDLSHNDFGGIQDPRFLGSMESLTYLNLSHAGFSGMIPHQFGNLSNLQYLDLSCYYCSLSAENLFWLSSLPLLEHLDLSYLDLSKASDWPLEINTFSSLKVLKLAGCQLQHFPPLSIVNFSSLVTLDLYNNRAPLIPSWVFGLSHLHFLDMSENEIQGPIPDGLQNLSSLRHLELSGNQFNSSIPTGLYSLTHLQYLSLSRNNLQGMISGAIGNLTSIEELDLSYNYKLEGPIPRSFGRLCNLRQIDFSYVKLSQAISEILDIFSGCLSDKLESLDLRSTQIFGFLTNQFGQFKNLHTFYLMNNSILGPIPSSLGELSSLINLDVSSNKLNGTLSQIHFRNLTKLSSFDASNNPLNVTISPEWTPPFQLEVLGLRYCHLGPQFPSWLLSQEFLYSIDISNSGILDSIPNKFWKSLSRFDVYLNISHNQIHGEIPSLAKEIHFFSLDLSSNNLSGPLPLIYPEFIINLSNNKFSGSISHFVCHRMHESYVIGCMSLQNWSPPDPDSLVFNVDGSVKGSNCQAGIGGVLRDHLGKDLCFFLSPIGIQDVAAAELLAIAKACELLVARPALLGKRLIIASDSHIAVSWINSRGLDNSNHGILIRFVCDSLVSLGNASVIFCPRSSNSFADSLAKRGADGEDETCWSE